MPACPVGSENRTGVVKIFACLELEPRLNIKTDLTGQAKLSIFQRSRLDVYVVRKDYVSEPKKTDAFLPVNTKFPTSLTNEPKLC